MSHSGSRPGSRPGSRSPHIKQAQKETLLFKEVSDLVMRIKADDSSLAPLIISRVSLSPDRKNCTIYLRTDSCNEKEYRELLQNLILYKPSLRTALAKRIPSRQTPEILFRYDKQFEKQRRIEELFEKIKQNEE